MKKSKTGWISLFFISACFSSSAHAECAIFGDSIGLGLGHALKGACSTTAEIGILSSVVASRVTAGDRWTIVSLGSNDYPTGLDAQMKSYSKARVEKALADVFAKAGDRLILILPANDAHAIVADWAGKHGIQTIGFDPGADGIHPRVAGYESMAHQIKTLLKID
jgi:lysophospholipase L1-like esterase